jgi:hypothetical protein
MFRVRVKGTGSKLCYSPDTEPDFYAMPFCTGNSMTTSDSLEHTIADAVADAVESMVSSPPPANTPAAVTTDEYNDDLTKTTEEAEEDFPEEGMPSWLAEVSVTSSSNSVTSSSLATSTSSGSLWSEADNTTSVWDGCSPVAAPISSATLRPLKAPWLLKNALSLTKDNGKTDMTIVSSSSKDNAEPTPMEEVPSYTMETTPCTSASTPPSLDDSNVTYCENHEKTADLFHQNFSDVLTTLVSDDDDDASTNFILNDEDFINPSLTTSKATASLSSSCSSPSLHAMILQQEQEDLILADPIFMLP